MLQIPRFDTCQCKKAHQDGVCANLQPIFGQMPATSTFPPLSGADVVGLGRCGQSAMTSLRLDVRRDIVLVVV